MNNQDARKNTPKEEQDAKIKIIKFNKNYNIIKIYRHKIIEYFLERVDYANLFYIIGSYEDIELTKNYILKSIQIAEELNFWNN